MRNLYLLPALAFLTLVGVLGWHLMHPAKNVHAAMMGEPLPGFALPYLSNNGSLSDNDFKQEPALLHFFASWCTSCVAESEVWHTLEKQTTIKRYAIAWNDPPEKTRDWLKKYGNPFTAVAVDANGKFGVALGLTGVPETLFIDQKGRIIWRWNQPLTADVVSETLLPLIQSQQQENP